MKPLLLSKVNNLPRLTDLILPLEDFRYIRLCPDTGDVGRKGRLRGRESRPRLHWLGPDDDEPPPSVPVVPEVAEEASDSLPALARPSSELPPLSAPPW